MSWKNISQTDRYEDGSDHGMREKVEERETSSSVETRTTQQPVAKSLFNDSLPYGDPKSETTTTRPKSDRSE